ncbi:hypothetical protein RCL_jg6408.t1 [Rhizophagus clarus]|uniref:Uncharacterized protein n=1 Tax=Rhizophagus clarus TaxID=94130 RepID=A0A8H3QH07_9GLOM|nr:hypothetical protein RCL_jg6408.t1 [Rhizophagus clarus]
MNLTLSSYQFGIQDNIQKISLYEPIGTIQFVLLDKATPSDVHIKFKFEPGAGFEEIGGFEKIGEIEEIGEIDKIKVVKGVIDDEVTEESKGSEELKDKIESDKDPYVETGGEGEAIVETLRGEVESRDNRRRDSR